ncbi:hypothetical protein BC828DRAFT_374469 [Blastocladiella britannica]|nr:hypothetical protein BC828DRAFT_374469 [Blastocladiella britannica]
MTTQQSDPSVPLPGETPQQYGLRRLRGWRPSPEERAVLEKYKVRAAGYSTTFMLGWSGLSFAFARYRKLALMPTFAITAVGAFLGSQAGKLAGIYQGLEEIKTLPNSELTQIMTDFTYAAYDFECGDGGYSF